MGKDGYHLTRFAQEVIIQVQALELRQGLQSIEAASGRKRRGWIRMEDSAGRHLSNLIGTSQLVREGPETMVLVVPGDELTSGWRQG